MTQYLLQILGPFFLLVSVSLFVNKSFYQSMVDDMGKNKALLFLSGFLTFVMGMLMVLAHNVWGTAAEVVVSFFGWMALLKGAAYILMPEKMFTFAKRFKGSIRYLSFAGGLYMALGVWATWVSYFA